MAERIKQITIDLSDLETDRLRFSQELDELQQELQRLREEAPDESKTAGSDLEAERDRCQYRRLFLCHQILELFGGDVSDVNVDMKNMEERFGLNPETECQDIADSLISLQDSL